MQRHTSHGLKAVRLLQRRCIETSYNDFVNIQTEVDSCSVWRGLTCSSPNISWTTPKARRVLQWMTLLVSILQKGGVCFPIFLHVLFIYSFQLHLAYYNIQTFTFHLSFLWFGAFWDIVKLHSLLFIRKTTQSLQLSIQPSSLSVVIKTPDFQEESSMFQSILMKMTPILILLYAIVAFTQVNQILHSRSATTPSLFNYQAISFGNGVYLTAEER